MSVTGWNIRKYYILLINLPFSFLRKCLDLFHLWRSPIWEPRSRKILQCNALQVRVLGSRPLSTSSRDWVVPVVALLRLCNFSFLRSARKCINKCSPFASGIVSKKCLYLHPVSSHKSIIMVVFIYKARVCSLSQLSGHLRTASTNERRHYICAVFSQCPRTFLDDLSQ